jgi:hypothetical protein
MKVSRDFLLNFQLILSTDSINPHSDSIHTTCFNALELSIPTTECIYLFLATPTIKSDFFSLNSINQLIFVTEKKYVSCEVRTVFLYID